MQWSEKDDSLIFDEPVVRSEGNHLKRIGTDSLGPSQTEIEEPIYDAEETAENSENVNTINISKEKLNIMWEKKAFPAPDLQQWDESVQLEMP